MRRQNNSHYSTARNNDASLDRESQLPLPPGGGAAASLRARLQQIRDRNRSLSDVGKSERNVLQNPPVPPTPPLSNQQISQEYGHQHKKAELHVNSYNDIYVSIEKILDLPIPIFDSHPVLVTGKDALGRLHSAIQSNDDELSTNIKIALKKDLNRCLGVLTKLIELGFRCGSPAKDASLSMSLLSVNLATMMAIFRKVELAKLVSESALSSLLRQASEGLLDPRLSTTNSSSSKDSSSTLDETVSSQLVRAMNKLAIQSAISCQRNVSLQALMSLQIQYCMSSVNGRHDTQHNTRMSRIATKLFARVIKAEEDSSLAFDESSVDMEAIFCSMEDILVSSNRVLTNEAGDDTVRELMQPCFDVARKLTSSVLKANESRERNFEDLMGIVSDLGIDPEESYLGRTFISVYSEQTGNAFPSNNSVATSGPGSRSTQFKASHQSNTGSVKAISRTSEEEIIAELINKVAKGEGQAEAICQLKKLILEKGLDINPHLTHLSAAFREHIKKQIQRSGVDNTSSSSSSTNEDQRSLPIKEQLKQLKSKINATEAAVHSVNKVENCEVREITKESSESASSNMSELINANAAESIDMSADMSTLREGYVAASNKLSPESNSTSQHERECNPLKLLSSFESKIEDGSHNKYQTTVSSSTPASSLRERLAASQESRSHYTTTSSFGPAAALRARLEAVKNSRSNSGNS